MEQIIIKKKNGEFFPFQSKKDITKITKAEQRMTLLGEDIVQISVDTVSAQDYTIGDEIYVFGRKYTLNSLPIAKKTGNRIFTYDLTFEGVQYELSRAQYEICLDDNIVSVQSDALMADLRRFMEILIQNANRISPGKWKLGECPDSDTRNLIFSNENCLAVLQRLCDEFIQEFEITQENDINTIHIRKAGNILPFIFQYGKGKGVYELSRQNVSSSNIITRLKAFGATKNIGPKYHNDRLCLPGKTKPESFIEEQESIEQYGIWEATQYFDEIYPKWSSSVKKTTNSVFEFIDEQMFNLNELESDGISTKYLIDGVSPKIHFNTGNLAGYEFDIESYDHNSKTFTLAEFTDERGVKFPSKTSKAFQIQGGEQYVLLDVVMPVSYVETAEKMLLEEAKIFLKQNAQPKVQYNLSIDERFLQKFTEEESITHFFSIGDSIDVKDEDLKVEKALRITGFSRNILNPYQYTLTIGDTVEKSMYTRIISNMIENDKIIQINELNDPAKARRKWRSSQEVLNMVFDPEGDYYTDKIKPSSIETQMLSIGAKSMQFMLQNTLIEANYEGNKNLVNVSGGYLTHFAIEDEIKEWAIASQKTSLEGDGNAFYIYAKCEKESNIGIIVFSTEQKKVDSDSNYYHFWIGVIHSVMNGVRAISLTYGSTTINGKFIRTGQIESTDGSCFFNLDQNKFRIGGKDSSLEWNTQEDGVLKLQGTIIQSKSGDSAPIEVYRGDYKNDKVYFAGDKVFYEGRFFVCLQNTYVGILPTNTNYWKAYSEEIQVGGTNYFKREVQQKGWGQNVAGSATATYYDDHVEIRTSTENTGSSGVFCANADTFITEDLKGKDVVVSFEISAHYPNLTANVFYNSDNSQLLTIRETPLYPKWNRVNLPIKNFQGGSLIINNLTRGVYYYFRNFQIETGNQPTDYKLSQYDIDNKIDNIQIGGANYFKRRMQTSGWAVNVIESATITYTDNYVCFLISGDKGVNLSRIHNYIAEDLTSKDVVVSFEAFSNAIGGSCNIYFDSDINQVLKLKLTGEWKRYQFTVKNFQGKNFIITNVSNNTFYYFRNFQIEIGNKATDYKWSEYDIKNIATRNCILNSRLNTIADWRTTDGTPTLIKDKNFGNVVQWERTASEGNWQKTFVDYAGQNLLLNTEVVFMVIAKRISNEGFFYFGNNTTGLVNKLNSNTCNSIDLNNGWRLYWFSFYNTIDFTTNLSGINSIQGTWQFYACGIFPGSYITEWTPAPEDIEEKIDNIQVGGRNYFKKSTSIKNLSGSGSLINRDENGFTWITAPSGYNEFRIEKVFTSNEEHTFSGYIKTNHENTNVEVQFADVIVGNIVSATKEYTYFEFTAPVKNYSINPDIYNFIDIKCGRYVYLYFKDIKVEKGNKATDWSPAPEDIENAIKNAIDIQPAYVYKGIYDAKIAYQADNYQVDLVKYNNTYYRAKRKVNGKFQGQTPSNNSEYWEYFGAQFESVATNLLLAELAYIKNLEVENLRTSPGGRRIEINAATNSLQFYEENKLGLSIEVRNNNGYNLCGLSFPNIDNIGSGILYYDCEGMKYQESGRIYLQGIWRNLKDNQWHMRIPLSDESKAISGEWYIDKNGYIRVK